MKAKHLFTGLLAALLVFPVMGAFAQDGGDAISIQLVTTFDYPGVNNSTICEGINDRGDITGFYTDVNGVNRGFIRFKSGDFSAPIVEPNDGGGLTEGRGINHSRTVAGFYVASDGSTNGYFVNRGNFTEYDVPGAFNTLIEGINNFGDFVGTNDSTGVLLAFRNIGGVLSTINISDASQSYAFGINRSRETTGQYTSASTGVIHGWYADAAGAVTTFDPPGAQQTLPFGINNQTFVVGRYTDGSSGLERGFLFNTKKGSYVSFDGPNAVFTSLNGINADGMICGRYDDGSGLLHGILARVVTGPADQPAHQTPRLQRVNRVVNNQE